jgi:hypothetical protein
MDRDSITADVAARLVAGQYPQWAGLPVVPVELACEGKIADLTAFAADLAGFLTALYAIDAAGGPPGGAHSAYRGGPLTTWDEQTRLRLRCRRRSRLRPGDGLDLLRR